MYRRWASGQPVVRGAGRLTSLRQNVAPGAGVGSGECCTKAAVGLQPKAMVRRTRRDSLQLPIACPGIVAEPKEQADEPHDGRSEVVLPRVGMSFNEARLDPPRP